MIVLTKYRVGLAGTRARSTALVTPALGSAILEA
jgi:hypothetical protein